MPDQRDHATSIFFGCNSAAWVSGKSRFPGRPALDQMWLLVKSHHKAVAKARAMSKRKPM